MDERYSAVDPDKIHSFLYNSSTGKIRIYEPGEKGKWIVTTTRSGIDRMAENMFEKKQVQEIGHLVQDDKAKESFIETIRARLVTPYKE